MTIVQSALAIDWTYKGLSVSVVYISPQDLTESLKLFYAINVLYVVANSMVRLAAILFFVRIFTTQKIWFRRSCHIVSALVACHCIISIFLWSFMCRPVQCFWDPMTPDCKCLDTRLVFLGTAIAYVVIDIAILILPLPLIWGMRLKLKQKLLVLALFIVAWG